MLGPRPEGHTVNRKPIEDYMTDEERTTYLEILEKARQRREEANKKPKMTELERQREHLRQLRESSKPSKLNKNDPDESLKIKTKRREASVISTKGDNIQWNA